MWWKFLWSMRLCKNSWVKTCSRPWKSNCQNLCHHQRTTGRWFQSELKLLRAVAPAMSLMWTLECFNWVCQFFFQCFGWDIFLRLFLVKSIKRWNKNYDTFRLQKQKTWLNSQNWGSLWGMEVHVSFRFATGRYGLGCGEFCRLRCSCHTSYLWPCSEQHGWWLDWCCFLVSWIQKFIPRNLCVFILYCYFIFGPWDCFLCGTKFFFQYYPGLTSGGQRVVHLGSRNWTCTAGHRKHYPTTFQNNSNHNI